MELIDRASLDFSFDRRCFSEGDEQYVRGADDAIGVVKNAPAIDAVPVVRCRECKYAYINSFSAASGVALCSHWTNKAAGAQMVVQQYDFCSYGRRKEAAHD